MLEGVTHHIKHVDTKNASVIFAMTGSEDIIFVGMRAHHDW